MKLRHRPFNTAIFMSQTSACLIISLTFSGMQHARGQERIWDNPIFAAQQWNVPANWDEDILPVDGDSLIFAPINSVAITAGTSQVNYNLNTPFISFTNNANLTMQVQTGIVLTVADISVNAANSLTLSRTGTGTIALGADANWEIGGTGTNFTGISVSSPITQAPIIPPATEPFKLTKSGPRALILTGANTFSGGITHKRAYIYTQNNAVGNPLGTGPFTFANETAGSNSVVSYLQFNSAFTQTFSNAFVNNNQSAGAFSSMQTGNSVGFITNTFSGPFSTGPDMAQTQVLQMAWNGSTTGIGEFTMQFTGDWSGYVGNGTTFALANGIRLYSGGTTLIGNPLAIAATNYQIGGDSAPAQNSTTAGTKLILNGPYTMNRKVSFLGVGNTTLNGMRNSFGTRTATGTTATLAGETAAVLPAINAAVLLNDIDGANLFAQEAGSNLAVTGKVTGNAAARLKINEGYTFSTGSSGTTSGTNTVQIPLGNVILSHPENDFTGGVEVANGALIVSNATGSATGTGSVTLGLIGAPTTLQSATVNSSTTAVTNTRILNAFNTATAQTLQIGQSISGGGIPADTIITGITTNKQLQNSVVTLSRTIPVPITPAVNAPVTYTDLATTSFTTNATLGGTGRISPMGANGLLVNSGSAINLVDGATGDLEVSFREIPAIPEVIDPPTPEVPAVPASGTATFSSGASFTFELGAPGTSDSVNFTGLAAPSTAAVVFNGNVVNFKGLAGISAGTYTLFTFDKVDGYNKLTASLQVGSLPLGFDGATFTYNDTNIQVTITGDGPSDYDNWTLSFDLDPATTGLPTFDADNDGLLNQDEYAFGLNPTSGTSVSPIVSTLNKSSGLFSYTRRLTSLTDLAYTYEFSDDLTDWDPFTPDGTTSDSGSPVEVITVDVPNALLTEPGLFIRVLAE